MVNFIRKVDFGIYMRTSVKYLSGASFKKELGCNFIAHVRNKGDGFEILINRSRFNHNTPAEEIKMMLLHEIGHIKEGLTEQKAHEWAIRKAKELKLKKVENSLRMIAYRWRYFGWNEEGGRFRKYIIASKRMFQ